MRHSIVVKFLMILLTACSLVAAVAGGAGIVAMEGAELYVNGLEELRERECSSIATSIANAYVQNYAAKTLGSVPYPLLQSRYPDPNNRGDAEHWTVKLQLGDQILEDPGVDKKYTHVKEYTLAPLFPVVTTYSPEDKPQEPTDPTGTTAPTQGGARRAPLDDAEVPDGYLYYDQETSWVGNGFQTYYVYYYQAPEYTVTVYMDDEVLESSALQILTMMFPYRYGFIFILAACILLFAAGAVFLCWSAGQTKEGTVRPGGLNRIPLDVYALAAGIGSVVLVALFVKLVEWVNHEGPHPGNLSLLGVNLLAIALLDIGFSFAFAAQIKAKNRYWWRHSVIGFCLGKLWLGIRFTATAAHKLFCLLPVIWQWLLTALAMVVAMGIAFLAAFGNSFFRVDSQFVLILLLTLAICCGVVLYGAYAFGLLISGAQKMSQGELSHKIPTKYLVGSFREFAEKLNTLSDAATILAEKQMYSERMKTELITNVSHDIKTPLTSIINFVDLLQKPHTQEQQEEYLDVLSRQSNQMKRLIEDLVDLSKANTGNMSVNLVQMDAVETVNQVLGEFADKLEAANLTPVFRKPEQPISIYADGKLVWRVMSNLLSNAVKYALPGTRLHVDLLQIESAVYLSLKNVSREELTATAEELMERFVRGDASRNTEGSGLGLNIAQSLMEVQKGRLELSVDGDLFKVTLVFPEASCS